MTYDEIRKKWPDQYAMRRAEKLNYRYPGAGGESYLDVINRLRAVIVEVERMSGKRHSLSVGGANILLYRPRFVDRSSCGGTRTTGLFPWVG